MKVHSLVATLVVIGSIVGVASAIDTPFDYESSGVEILDYTLDYHTMSIVLDVKVPKDGGSIETTFDRDFFDARHQGQDDVFIIIADGDLVMYHDIRITQDYRTIGFNLTPDIELVEIFGTSLDGYAFETQEQQNEQNQIIDGLLVQKEELESENNQLVEEVVELKSQNEILLVQKAKSDAKIFDPDNLASAVEKEINNVGKEINNFNAMLTEQFTSFVKWVTPK